MCREFVCGVSIHCRCGWESIRADQFQFWTQIDDQDEVILVRRE